jgi:hypothetical protein
MLNFTPKYYRSGEDFEAACNQRLKHPKLSINTLLSIQSPTCNYSFAHGS